MYKRQEQYNDADMIEIVDAEQTTLPADRFAEPLYARVRVVNAHGHSDWGPPLLVDPEVGQGFVELGEEQIEQNQPDTARPSTPRAIGFRLDTSDSNEVVELTWTISDAEDIQLQSVFSDSEGRQLAFDLPVRSSSGDPVRIPVFYIIIIGVTIILLWLLNILINRSMFGISMRALSFDMQAAKLMGINTDKVIAQTFAIGGACAAVAGNMVGIYNQSIEPLMGILPGLKAFIAAVVGGIGSIPGAAAGGMIMGLSEALVKGWIDPAWSAMADAVAFAILILVLLFKPSGIFGLSVKEKV